MATNLKSFINALKVLGSAKGDRVLIVSDSDSHNRDLADGFLKACLGQSHDCRSFDLAKVRPYTSVPNELRTLIKKLQPQIAINIFSSRVDELKFRVDLLREEQLQRAKVGHVLDANLEIFEKYMSNDFDNMTRKVLMLLTYLVEKKIKHVKVTTRKGTNLDFEVWGRQWHTDVRIEPGSIANFPCGEVFIAPVEKSVNGLLVADVSAGDFHKQESPSILTIKEGLMDIGRIESPLPKELQKIFATDELAKLVGEFGIGFNNNIKIDEVRATAILEKAYGTAHLAFGSNEDFGGINTSNIHIDFVFEKPDVCIDGAKIIENGDFIGHETLAGGRGVRGERA